MKSHIFLFFAFLFMSLVGASLSSQKTYAEDLTTADLPGWTEGVNVAFSVDENRGTVITVKVDQDLLDATWGDGFKVPANQIGRFNGDFVDDNPTDTTYRFENPNNEGNCGNKSEIGFVGTGNINGVTSGSGWVARFWADAKNDPGGDKCDSFVTPIHTPSGMGISDHGDVNYIDKVIISVKGVGYVDNDPFDGDNSSNGGLTTDNNYKTTNTTDCPAGDLNVVDFKASGNRGVLRSYKIFSSGSFDSCVVTGITMVNIGNTADRQITAYLTEKKTGDNQGLYVFMPFFYRNDKIPDYSSPDGTFALDASEANTFYRDRRNTGDIREWIKYDKDGDSRQFYEYCTNPAPCKTKSRIIIFANGGEVTELPSIYGTAEDVLAGISGLAAGGDEAVIETCESQNHAIGDWIFCLVIDGIDKTLNGLTNGADDLLSVESQDIYSSQELRAVWSYFRVIATFLLLAVGLVMVISQAFGG
ncbi:MAG: hypothetical protein M3P98_00090 [bacterium]|nr:hypothetical protein [bacterium]